TKVLPTKALATKVLPTKALATKVLPTKAPSDKRHGVNEDNSEIPIQNKRNYGSLTLFAKEFHKD
ncbi:MAG: hypothetical protein ACO3K2_08270, partial [Nitrosopumilaceae archaeon]